MNREVEVKVMEGGPTKGTDRVANFGIFSPKISNFGVLYRL
jgi:hypothetical protein